MPRTATAVRPTVPPAAPASRRDAILAAATRLFLSVGYGAASMEAIARSAGVAKQTLYAHFGNKATLFGAIMRERCDWLLEPLPSADAVGDDPTGALEAIAGRFIDIILAPESIARLRVVLAERDRFPELAEVFYESGPARASRGLADYLQRLHDRGVLHFADPRLAAGQFFGMIRGDLFLGHLLGLSVKPDRAETERIVRAAVRTFVAAHRPR
jgi:TetR/AcrR family transcriptional repressor of mexJK operon